MNVPELENPCYGCFKAAKDNLACIVCKYKMSTQAVDDAATRLNVDLGEGDLEEIKYELFCKMGDMEGEADRMAESGLAKIISRCADTAIYLPKKRAEDCDDMKVVLFDEKNTEAFITNGDVVIRLSEIPPDVLEGMNDDIPAYEYLSERFIPNPLPYSAEEMSKLFNDTFIHNITVPVEYVLEKIHRGYPDALSRRGAYAVIDLGYGMYEGSIIIPQFYRISNTDRMFFQMGESKPIFVDKSSIISESMLEERTSYIAIPVRVEYDAIYVDVYKKFEDQSVIGIYKIMAHYPDDIHPFNLEMYCNSDLIKFKLASAVDKFSDTQDKILHYSKFKPFMIECEYLYETLLLFANFGFEFVNLYTRLDAPILLEGIRCIEGQPRIEALMALVTVGDNGNNAEIELEHTQAVELGSL